MKDMATGDVMETQAPRVNGRHASMDASRQWTPRVNGRHASMDATPVLAAQAYLFSENGEIAFRRNS